MPLQLSFVEHQPDKQKEEKKSFTLMCQTPSKFNFFNILGHLLLGYHVAQNTRAIGRIYTAITGYPLIQLGGRTVGCQGQENLSRAVV